MVLRSEFDLTEIEIPMLFIRYWFQNFDCLASKGRLPLRVSYLFTTRLLVAAAP